MWKRVLTWVAKALGAAAVQVAADKLTAPKKPVE